MKIEKIENEIQENYLELMKFEDKKHIAENYRFGFAGSFFLALYFYFNFLILLILSIIGFLALIVNQARMKGFREGFKNGYLKANHIDINELEEEKLLNN